MRNLLANPVHKTKLESRTEIFKSSGTIHLPIENDSTHVSNSGVIHDVSKDRIGSRTCNNPLCLTTGEERKRETRSRWIAIAVCIRRGEGREGGVEEILRAESGSSRTNSPRIDKIGGLKCHFLLPARSQSVNDANRVAPNERQQCPILHRGTFHFGANPAESSVDCEFVRRTLVTNDPARG